ncbi:hypothetical protein ACFL2J_00295 [Candidatus Omnitrophota bacterium]
MRYGIQGNIGSIKDVLYRREKMSEKITNKVFLNADIRILHADSRRYLRPLALDLRKSALTNIKG